MSNFFNNFLDRWWFTLNFPFLWTFNRRLKEAEVHGRILTKLTKVLCYKVFLCYSVLINLFKLLLWYDNDFLSYKLLPFLRIARFSLKICFFWRKSFIQIIVSNHPILYGYLLALRSSIHWKMNSILRIFLKRLVFFLNNINL